MLTLGYLAKRLTLYDEHEAQSIMRLVLDDCFGITFTNICSGALDRMPDSDKSRLDSMILRLQHGEPVQYVIGKARFYDHDFLVTPDVLIPRPETEGLIDVVKHHCKALSHGCNPRILDIGTGSGCIAITLAREIPSAHVTAWDISDGALAIAKANADAIGAAVTFLKQDALNPPCHSKEYDIIVSNPPYICHREAIAMEANVLEHEPRLALFVPDDNPLLHYNSIISYASTALSPGGLLAFEVNPLYSKDVARLLRSHSFDGITVTEDEFGKQRIVTGKSGITPLDKSKK